MFLADLHVHTTFSDGLHSLPEVIDAYGSRGFGAVAITDHVCEEQTLIGKAAHYFRRTLTPATFPLYIEILKSEAERAWKQYRMVVIPGVELSYNCLKNSRSAHIVGLGVQEYIPVLPRIEEMTKAIRNQGALAIAAHPVSTRKAEKQTLHLWSRREELACEFDAWEVASGPYLFHEVFESGLPMVASSDMHSFKQLSSWKTVFTCERNPEAIFQAIRQQELSFQFYQERDVYGRFSDNFHRALGLRFGLSSTGHLLGI